MLDCAPLELKLSLYNSYNVKQITSQHREHLSKSKFPIFILLPAFTEQGFNYNTVISVFQMGCYAYIIYKGACTLDEPSTSAAVMCVVVRGVKCKLATNLQQSRSWNPLAEHSHTRSKRLKRSRSSLVSLSTLHEFVLISSRDTP